MLLIAIAALCFSSSHASHGSSISTPMRYPLSRNSMANIITNDENKNKITTSGKVTITLNEEW